MLTGIADDVPDKTADNIAYWVINEIIPCFGCELELISDNGSKNVNRAVQETLERLNIHHVTTSFYSSNLKVEGFHILAKRLLEGQDTWDLHLNQVQAAICFNVSEATGYLPYYLLYGCDVHVPGSYDH